MQIGVGTRLKNQVYVKHVLGWSKRRFRLQERVKTKDLMVTAGALLTSNANELAPNSVVGEGKLGVLLLNLGGPETLDDVQPFLFNLFSDPVISCC